MGRGEGLRELFSCDKGEGVGLRVGAEAVARESHVAKPCKGSGREGGRGFSRGAVAERRYGVGELEGDHRFVEEANSNSN